MADRLRVLMTTDAAGGVFTYTLGLVSALAQEDVAVSVAALGPRLSDEQRALVDAAGATDLRELPGKLEWMSEPWRDIAATGEALVRLEAELAPDVVHASSFFCGALPFRAPVLLVAHSCVCSWWRAVLGREAPAEWDRYRRVVRAGLDGADALVAPSAAMLGALAAAHGELPAGSAVIHNGIDLHRSRVQPQPLRGGPPTAVAAAEPHEPFVLAAGRTWDAAKNLELLAELAPQIGHPVLIAGERPREHRADRAPLLGQLSTSELARLRRRASVFAAPARYEPFGLSILEAAADGCALVLGDIGSLRELWNGAAVFVDPADGQGLVDRLRRLLEEPVLMAALGASAQQRAKRYSASAMAHRYAELYRTLAANAQAGARRSLAVDRSR